MSKEKLTQIITAALSGKVSCATSARIVPVIVKCLIERLEKGELSKAMTFNSHTVKRCVNEAIKEFINELEKRLTHYGIYSQYVKDTIMQVAKEMTENNDKE